MAVTTLNFDDCDAPTDVIDGLALRPFLAGEHRWARTARIGQARPGATLLPPDVVPAWQACDGGRLSALAQGDGWSVLVQRWPHGAATVTVTAVRDALADAVLSDCVAGAEVEPGPDEEVVRVAFWHLVGHDPRRWDRDLHVGEWPAIRRNYTRAVAGAFDRLMGLTPDAISGRLLLIHGPPGTGKTTALRALAYSWRSWCRFHYIVDPDQLFREPGYLLSVASKHAQDEDGSGPTWQLLIVEDCDELIRADAKASSGQALGRLLNLTDGMLGQGLNLLIVLTTNEPLSRLHPAVTRPGRCLAEIEVGRLSPIEASHWLGRPAGVATEGVTLAELFALAGDSDPIREKEPAARVGMYL